ETGFRGRDGARPELFVSALGVGQQRPKPHAVGFREACERDHARRTRAPRRLSGGDNRAIAYHSPEPASSRSAGVVPQRPAEAPEALVELSKIRKNDGLDEQAASRSIGDEIGVREFREQATRELVDRRIARDVKPGETGVPGAPESGKREPNHRIG